MVSDKSILNTVFNEVVYRAGNTFRKNDGSISKQQIDDVMVDLAIDVVRGSDFVRNTEKAEEVIKAFGYEYPIERVALEDEYGNLDDPKELAYIIVMESFLSSDRFTSLLNLMKSS